MKCPNCGCTLPEGKLFCEVCGEEINIVPDYDPDTDISIDLGNVFDRTKEINTTEVKMNKAIKTSDQNRNHSGKQTSNVRSNKQAPKSRPVKKIVYDNDEFDEDDDSYFDNDETISFNDPKELFYNFIDFWNKNIFSKIAVIGLSLIVIIALIVIVFGISAINKKSNYEHYKSEADKYYASKDYETAIDYYEKAISKGGDASLIKFNIADCYLADNQYNNAVFVLKEIADDYPNLVNECYDKIFNIYYDNNDFNSINEILLTCDNEEIIEKFQDYLCRKPDFSYAPGNYDESIYLEMTGSSNGYIYYTLDGEDPTESSELYTEPIFLDSGTFDVKAIFVTELGVVSEINEANYSVKSNAPLAPIISIESGTFNIPININVTSDLNCTTYYVCYRAGVKEEDRVNPDYNSSEYTTPLVMPMGPSEFRFISYNEEGVPSSVITRKYTVNIENAAVSKADAANIATIYRYSLGGVTDYDGHVSTANGKFEWIIEDAVRIKDTIYYVINEYYVDSTNSDKRTLTGLRYAVNINDSSDYGSLEQNVNGDFYVMKAATIE